MIKQTAYEELITCLYLQGLDKRILTYLIRYDENKDTLMSLTLDDINNKLYELEQSELDVKDTNIYDYPLYKPYFIPAVLKSLSEDNRINLRIFILHRLSLSKILKSFIYLPNLDTEDIISSFNSDIIGIINYFIKEYNKLKKEHKTINNTIILLDKIIYVQFGVIPNNEHRIKGTELIEILYCVIKYTKNNELIIP